VKLENSCKKIEILRNKNNILELNMVIYGHGKKFDWGRF